MMKRNCFVLNYAPHYRKEIFSLIDKNIDCDFYFGDSTYGKIKKLDYKELNNFVKELRFKKIVKSFYVLSGQSFLAFKKYKNFIITGQPYNLSSWFLLIYCKVLGKNVYIWNHGWYGNESKIQRLIKKLQFSFATGYFTYGNYSKEIMIDQGLREDKIHVIFNSLEYSKQLEVRKRLVTTKIYSNHFKNQFPTLLFIGRLTPIKKLDMIIEAMKISSERGINFNLVIIGDGSEKLKLESLVNKLDLSDNVWFYGKCYDEDKIGELIFNANLCVSPGNIGLTVIHSLSFGCPALTHSDFTKQMPEFEAVKEGVTGCFFDINNVTSLSKSIENWLSMYPQKNKTQIQECYNIIDNYYNPNLQLETLKKVLL